MNRSPSPLRASLSLVFIGLLSLGVTIQVTRAEQVAEESEARLQALRAEIAHHDELYFRQAAPEITDYEYDLLKAELHRLEQALHPSAEKTDTIGDDRTGDGARVVHGRPMLSLDKAYGAEEVASFLQRVQQDTGQAAPMLVLEPKYDGIAIEVVLQRGHLVRAATRGDGTTGEDVTAQVGALRSLDYEWGFDEGVVGAPARIETIALRGEIFLDDAAFERLNRDRIEAGEEPYRHPRNVAAGTIKLDDLAEIQRRGLSIVFHGWGEVEPAEAAPPSVHAFQLWLGAVGLPGVQDSAEVATADPAALEAAVADLRARIAGFPTDGVVIKVDDVALQQRCGDGPTAPRWALARKFAPPRAETRLRAIVWQVGRTGVLTPVAEFDPVELGGAQIGRASLHNAGELQRRDLCLGDTVWIEKAGEIIPVVAGVDLARRPAAALPCVAPTDCPCCGGPLQATAGGTELRCGQGADCPAQCVQRLVYYAARSAVGIRGLGPGLAQKLVEAGLVRTPADLYALQEDDLTALPGVGTVTAQRLLAAIEASRSAALWRIVVGVGAEGVGPQTARELASRLTGVGDLLTDPALATAMSDPVVRETVLGLQAAGVGELVAGAAPQE